jgi:hypothetical protein
VTGEPFGGVLGEVVGGAVGGSDGGRDGDPVGVCESECVIHALQLTGHTEK